MKEFISSELINLNDVLTATVDTVSTYGLESYVVRIFTKDYEILHMSTFMSKESAKNQVWKKFQQLNTSKLIEKG